MSKDDMSVLKRRLHSESTGRVLFFLPFWFLHTVGPVAGFVACSIEQASTTLGSWVSSVLAAHQWTQCNDDYGQLEKVYSILSTISSSLTLSVGQL